jgi:hypothetical protein
MPKWWWWWLPGFHKKWKLEQRRREAISGITGEREFVEIMAQRPRPADDLDEVLLEEVLRKLDGFLNKAKAQETTAGELDDLEDNAELQGLFAAYLCPAAEIKSEGELTLDQIEGWGIPQSSTAKVSELWRAASKNLTTPVEWDSANEGRTALYALFQERDAWDDFLDDHYKEQRRTKALLFGAVIFFLIFSVFAVYFAHSWMWMPLLTIGILAAGVAGSCASVVSKMPTLENILSRKTDTKTSRKTETKPDASGGIVLARIATGLIGTVIVSALLAWIPLSIENKSFGQLLKACSACCGTRACCAPDACTVVDMLILIGVPALLGFSERTMPFAEQGFFGATSAAAKKMSRKG